jgi:hypothetical protein
VWARTAPAPPPPQKGAAEARLARPLLRAAATSPQRLLAGLAAGSDGWSFAWADEWTLLREIRAPRSITPSNTSSMSPWRMTWPFAPRHTGRPASFVAGWKRMPSITKTAR